MLISSLVTLTFVSAAFGFPQEHIRRQSGPNPPLSTANAGALYFMSNNPSGNVLHAVPVGANGQLNLGQGTQYATGGNGGRISVSPGTPSSVGVNSLDALSSQGSVTVAGNKIYVVNPGSNTLSLFNISCTDPTDLHQLGPPVNTLGDFPTAVGASSVLDTACVANTGANSGVACFGLDFEGLVPLDRAQRPLSLPIPGGQTNPPTGPAGTFSQVLFNNDLSELLVVAKGNNSGEGGYLASFPVSNSGEIGTTPSMNTPADSYVLCGTTVFSNNNVGIVDSVTGALLLSRKSPGVYETGATVSGYGVHYRWLAQSPTTSYVYSTAGSTIQIGEVNVLNSYSANHKFPYGGLGSVGETVAAGQFLYTLSYGNATDGQYILVSQDAQNNGQLSDIQQFSLAGLGLNSAVSGLAAFIPGEVDQQCTPETPV